jgi:hypothetical protein
MFRFFLSFASLCATCSLSFAQTFEKAVDYMQFMSNKQTEILQSHMSYTSAVAHNKSGRKIDKRRKELVQSMLNAITTIKALPDWKGDATLRDSTVSFINSSYHILNEDYAKIIDLEEVAEQSYDAMEAYINAQELANEKINEAQKRLHKVIEAFAGKNNITLVDGKESELEKKVIASSKVNKYHREIYLIFFKANNQERYLVEAINKKDINAIEQSKNTLEKYSQEGLAKLLKIKPFNADNSVVDACRKVFMFYMKECKEHVPATLDFYAKQENMDKLRTALESKGESRTKPEVDAFNKSVKDYNAAVNKYNTSNNNINKLRSEHIDLWNNACDKFFDKHTPKY